MSDIALLQRAVELAEMSKEPLGCGVVITSGGNIVAETYNLQREDNIAINHAEIKAIVSANKSLRSRQVGEGVAYCSCEPCVMCLVALSYEKIEKIVYFKSMIQSYPDDPQSSFDSQAVIQRLNFVPIFVQRKNKQISSKYVN